MANTSNASFGKLPYQLINILKTNKMFNIQFLKTTFLVLASTQIIFSQKKDMSIIDFLNIPGISSVSLSPNGNKIVYILSESDWKENKQIPNLWLADLNSGVSQKITFEKKGLATQMVTRFKVISFTSSKEGFIDDEDDEFDSGNNQIYLLPTKIGSPKNFQITELELAILLGQMIQNIFIS